ncbi:MJ1316 domain-containing protein [Balamuthia mandrillaris]
MSDGEGGDGKNKLRSSKDVYDRLCWDCTWPTADVVIGYEDRFEGMMEIDFDEFCPNEKGGDIPFHRIWYFRTDSEVIWDRRKRYDRVFRSGDTEAIEQQQQQQQQNQNHNNNGNDRNATVQ